MKHCPQLEILQRPLMVLAVHSLQQCYVHGGGGQHAAHSHLDGACTTGCGTLCQADAYHAVFPQQVLEEGRPICLLDALIVAVAIKLWTPTLAGRWVVLHSNSTMAVAIFQAGKGRDSYIRVCAIEV